MIRIEFAPEAKAEFGDAKRYYDQQLQGLGERFRDEVRGALRRMRLWPLAAPVERGDIRRLVLSRFPYKLPYAVEGDCLYVVAVAHQHRAPEYWVDRRSR